jgi:hypothetical protein
VYHPSTSVEATATVAPATVRRSCLVEGCPCKDPRMVSRRRAAFHAAVARSRGETAYRSIPADPSWQLPRLVP